MSACDVLLRFLVLAKTLDILPQVPPRPDRDPNVPELDFGWIRLVTGGPSESIGEPCKCSTDLDRAPLSMERENVPTFRGESVGLRSFGVPSKILQKKGLSSLKNVLGPCCR